MNSTSNDNLNLTLAYISGMLIFGIALEVGRRIRESFYSCSKRRLRSRRPLVRRLLLAVVHIYALHIVIDELGHGWSRHQEPKMQLIIWGYLLATVCGIYLSPSPVESPWQPLKNSRGKPWRQLEWERRSYESLGQYENGWFYGSAMFLAVIETTATFAFITYLLGSVYNPSKWQWRIFFGCPALVWAIWWCIQLVEPWTNWLKAAQGSYLEPSIDAAPTVRREQQAVLPSFGKVLAKVEARARSRRERRKQ